MSFSCTLGRRSLYDDYTANYCTVQARNNNDGAFYLSLGAYCSIDSPYLGQALGWYVAGWEYSDGYSPAECFVTITLISCYGFLGRDTTAASIPGTTWTALDQIEYLYVVNNQRGGLPPYVDVPLSGSQFAYTVPAGTNVATFLQDAVRTEWGRVFEGDQTVYFSPLGSLGSYHMTIGLSTSPSSLRWDTFSRTGADIDSFRNVALTSTYGQYANSSTGDAQQLALTTNHVGGAGNHPIATYGIGIVYAISGLEPGMPAGSTVDPPKQFVVTITDGAQDANALSTFEALLPYSPNATASLTYYDPRTGTTTYTCAVEGVEINSRPGVTTYRIYATELSGYPVFVLDSDLLGVLNYNRLGF
jgi:hypothetical protein